MTGKRRGQDSLLCQVCENQVRLELAELPQLYEECAPSLARSASAFAEKVSRTRGIPSPASEAGIMARSTMLSVLGSWSDVVTGALGVTAPTGRDVERLVTFLTAHLDWIAAGALAAEFADAMAELARTAHQAAYPDSTPQLDLGPCIHTGCGSTMFAVVIGDDPGVPPNRVRCAAGHSWGPHQWLLLAHRIQQEPTAEIHERTS